MSTVMMALFQLGGLFFDFNLVLKIVGMLFIYSFVRSHVQHPLLSLLLIVGLCAFLLFDFWIIFGGALVLYLLAIFGVMHILVDLSFMHAFTRPLMNLGGMFSGKPRPQPNMGSPGGQPPMSQYEEYEHERQQGHHERGDEQGPEHQGDARHPTQAVSKQEYQRRAQAQYERLRRAGRARDDRRG